MRQFSINIIIVLIALSSNLFAQTNNNELNAFWIEAERQVKEGDFEAYSTSFHQDAILINGISKNSIPIKEALDGWEKGFEDTRQKQMETNIEFRFTETILGTSSAYQKGIFLYTSEYVEQSPVSVFIHFEVLLTKSYGIWKILMEYQKEYATQEDWNRLE
ncbi:MAG: hypothetical protein CL672_07540 [Balneola sp.]|nr:hypothetical protein [Balneola sp.]|tara:strand:- start:49 stop:531 length:483 start_codon:yes stop_codon:yes gene_type:complete